MIHPEGRFQQLLDGLVGRRGIHHALLAIESGDGSLKWTGTAGEADPSGRPMTPETPYFIASVTKLYYAALVLRLAERGLVDLDAPFTRYLDASLTDRLHVMAGTDRTVQITVRHLASHTSGLPDYIEDKPNKGPRFIDRVLAEGDRELPLAEVLRMVREELEPHFPPQDLASGGPARARYSDTNFALLRAIIEAVTGRDWPDALAFELLKPLGLRHTWVAKSDPLEKPPVAAATLWGGPEPFEMPRLLASVGDLYSTVADQMAFIRALINGSAFDNADSARTMWTGWHTLGFDPTTPRLAGWPIAYAFGSMRFALPRWLTPLGTVPAVEGHSGSTGCWLFYAPEIDVFTCGTVDQVTAAAVPYRILPKVTKALA
jgi:D-alanyl-D-alanine carboxypeptidase